MNNNNNLIDDILKAIDIMATKKISSAGYDKTIQGTIISCQDRTIGKYKIKYQDGYWYAYSTSGDVYYSNGTSVYILIPNGDMRKEKTILGAVQKLGTNYLNILEQEQKYNFIGNNIIVDNNVIFSLSSYKENGDTIVLYNKNNSSSENLIQINQQQMIQYLKQSPSFVIGADIQTQLNIEQQYQGNYGILVGLNFLDNATKSEVTRYYMVDVDMMTGNPYRFINGVHQSGIFEIDNQNFLNIDSISLFAKDFPNEDNSKPKDIFISNLEIKGAVKLSQTELDSYALLLNTPKGYIFNDQSLDTDTRRIEAEVRIKGKTVNLKAQSLPFYWFVQNNTITAKSEKYNRYGGQGWECLNQHNTLNNKTLQYIPMSNILQVKKTDILIEKVKYKCVTIYDNTILSKEITIINKDAEYRIFVESDQGTIFKYDVGSPTLTCHCQRKNAQNDFEDVDINNYKFVWSCINNVGNFESLTDSLEYIINENKIINLNIKNITRFATYKCAVFTKQNHGNNFLGTASITLSNLLQSSGFYTLIINNGSQVFKYNTFGVSPASEQNAIPLEIPTLNFTVFDDIGNPVSDDIIKYSDITWTVPIENTLLKIDDSYQGDINSTLSKKSYKNLMSLSYGIAELYDPSKIDNTIQLKVNYNGMTLVANTNLTFTKEGNSGTNGTDFVCKIVPNVIQGGNVPVCPTLYFTDNNNFELNWITDLQTNHWFKAELWHNGNEPIFSGYQEGLSTEGKDVFIISWEVLKNKYNSRVYDDSNINISTQDGLKGRFSFDAGSGWSGTWDQAAYVTNWVPANIIKVTLQYDGLIYYATLPLIIVKKFDSDYKLNLKPNTGFRQVVYTSAGIQPSYNNRIPFELTLQHKINSYWENVTDSSQISYKWYYFGSIKERGSISSEPKIIQRELTKEDGSSTNFWLMSDERLEELKPYQKRIKPADQYDGECVNIGLGCRVYSGSTTLAWIHIPIHMLRNKFENSVLNGWDGNSIDLGDDNGGTILAPQIGAGYKDNNNRFTGIVMGKSKDSKAIDSNDSQGTIEDKTGKKFVNEKEDVGLFGFHEGSRSIFLDARTGKAVFGEKGKAQIVLDPSQIKNGKPVAQIKSGDYNYNPGVTVGAEAGTGMMIDLSTPQIKYGTGNFEVNQNGHLIAKGGGQIAGWEINNTAMFNKFTTTGVNRNSTGMNANPIVDSTSTSINGNGNGSEYRSVRIPPVTAEQGTTGYKTVGKSAAFWAGGEKFFVTHDGYLRAQEASIGSGTKPIFIGKSGDNSAIFSGLKSSKTANISGFYLGLDGLGIGKTYTDNEGNNISNFQVDEDGSFYARSGYIGSKSQGWTVEYNKMYNGANTFEKPGFFLSPTQGISLVSGTISDGIDDSKRILFSVNRSGKMTARQADIANWRMTNNMLLTAQKNSDGTDSESYPTRGNGKYSRQNETITIYTPNFASPNNVAITQTGIRVGNSFLVTIGEGSQTGKMYCTNAYLSGTIYGTAGKIGGWTIGDGKIYSSKIELNANNNVIAVGTNMTLDGTNGSIKLGGGSYNTTFSSDGCYISANGFAGFNTAYIEDLRIYAPRISGNLYHLGMDSDRVVIALDGSSIRFKDIDREYNPFQYSNFYNLKTYKAKYKKGFLIQGDIWQDKYLPMFVAEDVAELQPLAAKYDNNGQVQDWNYRVIIPIQHLLIRDLNDRVSTLQKQIKELKQLINK